MTGSTRFADALGAATAVLAHRPAGFVSDLDGTLAPIAPRPQDARLVEGAGATLVELRARLPLVAIVTGRAPADARGMVEDDQILVVGNHGLEWLEPGKEEPGAPEGVAEKIGPAMGLIREAVAAIRERMENVSGLIFEEKGATASVHYRLATDPDAAREAIDAALDETGAFGALDIRQGRMSVELRPRGIGDKGSALRTIIERHALRGLLLFGDDRTDLDMFRVAAELRAAGELAAFIGAVGAGGEVPEEVREAADAVIDSPTELVELLRQLY